MTEPDEKTEVNTLYWFYTWGLTILISPLFWAIYRCLLKGENWSDQISLVYLCWVMGFLFSIPVLFIFTFIFFFLIKKKVDEINTKAVLLVTGILGITVSFYLISGTLAKELAVYYTVGFIISIFSAKYERKV